MCSLLCYSNIPAHHELLLSYERPSRLLISIDDALGGALPVSACRCGSVFCCGDILRRLSSGKPEKADTLFFTNTAPELKIRLNAITKANKAWYDTTAASYRPSDEEKDNFLRAHKLMLADIPPASTVYKHYLRTKFGQRKLPHYLRSLTGWNDKWDEEESAME